MEEEEGRWIRGSIINICEYECISCIGIRGGNLYGRDPSDSEEIIENYVIVYEGRAFSFSWRRRFSPHEETDVFFFFFERELKARQQFPLIIYGVRVYRTCCSTASRDARDDKSSG